MAEAPTLINLANLTNQTTAVAAINSNSSAISTAFEDVLSLSGTVPNQMQSNLDMNSNRILNLPTPLSNYEPIRLIDAATISGGGITVSPLPSGGTTGQVLEKNSSTNFDVSWQTAQQIPVGGTSHQALIKNSSTNFDTSWSTLIPAGGTQGQALVKTSNSDYATSWGSVNNVFITPEQFGAVGNGSTDDTVALQNAINAAITANTYLQLGPKTYKFTSTLTVATGIAIRGTSEGIGSILLYAPTANGSALHYTSGPSVQSYGCLEQVTLTTNDTTFAKKGVHLTDFSVFTMRDVRISNFFGGPTLTVSGASNNGSGLIRLTTSSTASLPTTFAVNVSAIVGTTEANHAWKAIVIDTTHIDLMGSTFSNTYSSGGSVALASIGCQLEGRELGVFDNTQMQGDIGLRISANPNNAFGALDTTNFNNSTFTSSGTGSTILVDDGVTMANISWTGTQSRGEGKDGFRWVSKTDPAISENISFENTRDEQASTTGGWHYTVSTSSPIYGLNFKNCQNVLNGYYIRNVRNLVISECTGMSNTLINYDIDSTVTNASFFGNYWFAGSTANVSGQSVLFSSALPSGVNVPSTAFYTNTVPVTNNLTSSTTVEGTLSVQGATTVGVSGSTQGEIIFNNTTSGSITLQAPGTGAMGTVTLTLPISSSPDTLIAKATVDTLTNKTFDTAGTGNFFKINGTTISANTGTGSNVLATTPTITTPVLSGTVTGTYNLAGTPSIAGTAIAGITGTGNLVLATGPTISGMTLGGTLLGGGNAFNNVGSIGTTSPGTGNFTSIGATSTGTGAFTTLTTSSTINGATLDNLAWSSYTPTVTSATGSGLTTSASSGFFKQIGKTVHWQATITINAVGTAGGALNVTLPVASLHNTILSGLDATAGTQMVGFNVATNSTGVFTKYDGTSPIATHVYDFSGVYEST